MTPLRKIAADLLAAGVVSNDPKALIRPAALRDYLARREAAERRACRARHPAGKKLGRRDYEILMRAPGSLL